MIAEPRRKASGKRRAGGPILRLGARGGGVTLSGMSLISMTGFGKAEQRCPGGRLTVEISSLNRRQLEVSVNLPREWSELEPELRGLVSAAMSRGRAQVSVALTRDDTSGLRVNRAAAKAYRDAMQALAADLKLAGDVTLDAVLRAPGVMESGGLPSAESVRAAVVRAVKSAVTAWTETRAAEGAHLQKTFGTQLARLRRGVKLVGKAAPAQVARQRETLRRRLVDAGLTAAADDPSLRRELVMFADRVDVTEELTRLESHFAQLEAAMTGGGAQGRRMEFLLQEMGREVNTIGSKSQDVSISHEVVELKTTLEKMREQVQNVE